jgi:hypothetical protein
MLLSYNHKRELMKAAEEQRRRMEVEVAVAAHERQPVGQVGAAVGGDATNADYDTMRRHLSLKGMCQLE